MESEIASITAIAAKQRELPVWEKFETNPEDHARVSMDAPPKMSGMSPAWFTSNMEYGRFQLQNRGFPGEGKTCQAAEELNPPPHESRPQSTGGQSYLEDKHDPEAVDPEQEHEEQERIQTGVRNLGPIDPKYMAASRRGNRPDQEPTNRMTTGYAKQWMTSENGRFWSNIQEVAPLAGFDVSVRDSGSRTGSSGTNAEILKVE